MLSFVGVLFLSVLSLFAPAPVAQVRAAVPVQSVHQAAPAAASLAGSSVVALLGGSVAPVAKGISGGNGPVQPAAMQECSVVALDFCPQLEYDVARADRAQQIVYNSSKPFLGDIAGQAAGGFTVMIIAALVLKVVRH